MSHARSSEQNVLETLIDICQASQARRHGQEPTVGTKVTKILVDQSGPAAASR